MKEIIYNPAYPSVTEVLDQLRKKALEEWFKRETPEFINMECQKGLAVGREVHRVIEAHIEEEGYEFETEFPDEVGNAIKSFALFRKEYPKIKFKKSELKMTSETFKTNGKLDVLANDGTLLILDWKIQKCYSGDVPPVFEESIHQVSAYVQVYNDAYGLTGTPKEVKRGAVVPIAKDRVAYNFLLLTENIMKESFNDVFLPAHKILSYKIRNGYADKRRFGNETKKGSYGTVKTDDNNRDCKPGNGQGNTVDKKGNSGLGSKGRKLPGGF